MILLIDVGNSTTIMGVHDEEKIVCKFNLSTDQKKTPYDLGVQVITLFNLYNIKVSDIDGAIISSVVPQVNKVIKSMCLTFFNVTPLVLGPGIKSGINMKMDNPKEVGADRIANAVAAYNIYKKSLIVVDFGTATTLCYINEKGTYMGGLICPGIIISYESLFNKTAKLQRVELSKREKLLGKNTVDSLKSGLFYSYQYMIDGLIKNFKKEIINDYKEDAMVIATGEIDKTLLQEIKAIDKYEENLTLKGLKIIYDKNK